MYNQGNYQQFGQRLPAVPPPPPPLLQQAAAPPYGPPVSVPPSGMLTSSQSYLIPPPSLHNPNWSQSQHILPPIPASGNQITPRIPAPHLHGQHYYRVAPPLPPPPTSSYFTPARFGLSVQPPHDSSLGQLPPPPPPPPPSSPPPGPPSLPLSSPPAPCVVNTVTSGGIDSSLNCKDVNGCEKSMKDTPDFNIASDIPPPPPRPRDEKIVRKIEVLCQYIAKNGPNFEHMTCQKEVGNPEFEFLFGGVPGSEAAISHEYFKLMKKKCCSGELLEGRHDKDISVKLSVLGTPHEDIAHSPAGSDMDMEDDITQPGVPGIVKSRESGYNEPTSTSNEVDIKVEEHVCDSKNVPHKDATDGKVFCSDPSQVIEQGPNPLGTVCSLESQY